MLLGLRTAIYPVSDLRDAKNWYTSVVGHVPYFDQPFYVGFNVGGFELGLIPDGEASRAGAQPLWGVGNIDEVFAKLVALGATPIETPKEVGDGVKVAAVEDPFGNRLGLIENAHFDPKTVR
jgi:predicted enzyme related to lactoylglutathione lyase